MPVDYSAYPKDWRRVSAAVRYGRAGQRCECTGQCGLHQPNPSPRRCTERHKTAARFAGGRIILTTAHTCTCYPLCSTEDHLLAMCQACHLRFDRRRHTQATNGQARKSSYIARKYRATAARLHFPGVPLAWTSPKSKRTPLWTGRDDDTPHG